MTQEDRTLTLKTVKLMRLLKQVWKLWVDSPAYKGRNPGHDAEAYAFGHVASEQLRILANKLETDNEDDFVEARRRDVCERCSRYCDTIESRRKSDGITHTSECCGADLAILEDWFNQEIVTLEKVAEQCSAE